ncbi:MAG: hypothetical protein IKP30_03255 [Bacteroidaceae bacterium]|nr:hypothetical protein [Bacteroidaceae bacterium]
MSTLAELARAYYQEGCRGRPISDRHSRRLFHQDLLFGNGKFKAIRALLKRMGWYENRRLTKPQLQLIYARLGEA